VINRHLLGVSHLLWASHFPLDTADWPDDRQRAMQLTEEIPEEDRQALLAENTARLYRLPGYESGVEATETFTKLVHY
jgi:predicted TIM-barrel fold metal-dependent hydrolase